MKLPDPSDPLRLATLAYIPARGLPYRHKTDETIEVELPDGPVHVRPGASVKDHEGKVVGRVESAHVEGDGLYIDMTIVAVLRLDMIHFSFEVPQR